MAFTMIELRQELQALGYGDLPDEFIVSSLSQLQLHIIPQSVKEGDKNRSYSRRVRAEGKPSSRQVHGSPVPGDREFVATSTRSAVHKKKEVGSSTVRRGGLDSVCFTPDFAAELDEMRKMLRIMHGTKENLFGSGSGSGGSGASFNTKGAVRKPIGLADEHELYVGNLLDQWRVVGRALRSKREQYRPANVGNAMPSDCNSGASTSETAGRHHGLEQHRHASNSENRNHRHKQNDAPVKIEGQPPANEPSTARGVLERSENSCDLQVERAEEGNTSAQEESLIGKVETDYHHHQKVCMTATGEIENDLHQGDSNALEKSGRRTGVVDVTENETTGRTYTRQESSSSISPEVSYQQGGMLYIENFTADTYHKEQSDDLLRTDEEDTLVPSHQDVAEDDSNPSPSSPRSYSAQTPKEVLDKVSALSKDQFLAAFEQSLDDMDPRDVIDQETFANVNQRILDTTASRHNNSNTRVIPVESENPVLRTPDRRGVGGGRSGPRHGNQSPLNDRSNMRFAEEDPEVPHYSHSGPDKKKKWDSSVTAAAKRNSTVILKRSRSSRGVPRRNEIVEEANDTHLSDIVEGKQVDSHHPVINSTTTPPSSAARKLKSSDNTLRQSLFETSEKSTISPRITLRNKGGASDTASPSDLDISSLGLSPIKVREQPASPLNHSLRERSCAANGYHEHRSCSVCNPTPLRKSGDSNNSQSSSKTSETIASELEASPQQKRSSVRKEAAGPILKHKLPLKKNSTAPSGIYTPLDPKKNELNRSKVLLSTRRLASSMDFTSDTSRLPYDRRAPSLRSSTESSRSSGPHRAASSQSQVSKSNSGSSPYGKSSSFSSFSSRSATPKDILTSPFDKSSSFGSRSSATTKGTLTPGGPRRSGKVDRVARFAEMQSLWKNDKFLKASSKRKPQSFHRIFARLHLSHERCTAAYRERVLEEARPSTASPPFVVQTSNSNSEGVCIF